MADHWTGLLKETDISWSGTVTLLFLWGIGPLIYFGIYLVQVLQHRRSPKDTDQDNHKEDGHNSEEEHNTGGVVVVKNTKEEEQEKEATTNNTQEWTSTQYLFALVGVRLVGPPCCYWDRSNYRRRPFPYLLPCLLPPLLFLLLLLSLLILFFLLSLLRLLCLFCVSYDGIK